VGVVLFELGKTVFNSDENVFRAQTNWKNFLRTWSNPFSLNRRRAQSGNFRSLRRAVNDSTWHGPVEDR
jgi:hypothetical protein